MKNVPEQGHISHLLHGPTFILHETFPENLLRPHMRSGIACASDNKNCWGTAHENFTMKAHPALEAIDKSRAAQATRKNRYQ